MLHFSVACFLHFAEAFQFDELPIGFLLLFRSPQMHIWKEDPMANVKDVAAYLFLCMVSGLTFRSFIHFEFIFYIYGVRKWSSLILLHGAAWFSENHLFLSCDQG